MQAIVPVASCVERLVDAERDLAARDQLAANEVVVEDRAGERGHRLQYS